MCCHAATSQKGRLVRTLGAFSTFGERESLGISSHGRIALDLCEFCVQCVFDYGER